MSARTYLLLAALACLLFVLGLSIATSDLPYGLLSGVLAVLLVVILVRMDHRE